jgi:hypothetical protein
MVLAELEKPGVSDISAEQLDEMQGEVSARARRLLSSHPDDLADQNDRRLLYQHLDALEGVELCVVLDQPGEVVQVRLFASQID